MAGRRTAMIMNSMKRKRFREVHIGRRFIPVGLFGEATRAQYVKINGGKAYIASSIMDEHSWSKRGVFMPSETECLELPR